MVGLEGSSKGEPESGTESAMELLDKGIDVPVEGVDVPVDDEVIVAALSCGANLPLTHACSCQEMLGARLICSIEDEVIGNTVNMLEAQADFRNDRPLDMDMVTWDGVMLT